MSKNNRIEALNVSQELGVTKMTPQQLEDAKRMAHSNKLFSDPLLHERVLIQSRIKELKQDLPHLHGQPFYAWQRKFFESRNKINLLCAANQIGKSTIAIKKNIEWACNKKLWPSLWSTEPKIFWYFYPSEGVADVEVTKKWIPEFLPRGAMKVHENYGWDIEYSNGSLIGLHFKSGVSIFFKSYGQKAVNLQTATVHMITADEEMPEEYVDELMARLRATGGYYNQVFTATRGLPLWYRAMECIGGPDEAFRTANKQVVSLYDCKVYEDGSPSGWTNERITEAENACTSKKEVLKRIHGRFVKDEGLRYESFNPERNVKQATEPPPKNWKYYAGVDIGSGGASAAGTARSSAAIVIIATNPEYTKARVVRSWRGDHQETTATDILKKYREMKQGLVITQATYDYASREFGLVASRLGEGFIRADKSRTSGEATLNLLFKAEALDIDYAEGDNTKLVTELMSIPGGDKKNRKYQDDLADTLKYVCAIVPWDFARISPGLNREVAREDVRDDVPDASWGQAEYAAWEIRQRRGELGPIGGKQNEWQSFAEEIDAWNDAYGS